MKDLAGTGPGTFGPELFDTIAAFRDCRTPPEVGALLLQAIAPLEMRHYAIGAMPGPEDRAPTPFIYHNWPEAWVQAYHERNFGLIDPVPRAAMSCAMPLTLAELRAGTAGFVPGPDCAPYFEAVDSLLSPNGLIVPIAGPHGYNGIVVLAGGPHADYPPAVRAALHLLALYAHARLRDLFAPTAPGPQLSRREVAVLRLARSGMGDEAIAQGLEISVRTVRFHFENARHKLEARSRAEALVKAVGLHLLGN